MSKESKTDMAVGDQYRIDRDYAMMLIENIDIAKIDQYSESDLQEISKGFHDAQKKLLGSLAKRDQRSECSVTISFEQAYRKLIVLVRQNSAKSSSSSTSETVTAKLPKINIKPFDGQLENWVSFKQLFDSLIHRRNISNIEKLHYLMTCVQNAAYDLIKNFPLTEESYVDAYNTLSRYYDKKRQLAISYFDKLVNCKPIKQKCGSELERVSKVFTDNLAVLSKYNLPDKNFMLFHLFWSKLDDSTREAFQLEHNSDDIPEFTNLQAFVEKHVRASDVTRTFKPFKPPPMVASKTTQNKRQSFVVATSTCIFCNRNHSLFNCTEFSNLDVMSRFNFVKEKSLCINCFSDSHRVKNCISKYRCQLCNLSHHTLLHFTKPVKKDEPSQSTHNEVLPNPVVLTSLTSSSTVLFSTAKILVKDGRGNYQSVRALLDCASACNFMTKACAQRLGLPIVSDSQNVCGIGHSIATPNGTVFCEVTPMHTPQPRLQVQAFVLPSICNDQPCSLINPGSWSHIKGIELADPDFHCPGPIDMLLNVEIFSLALVPGLRQGKQGQPTAINSIFGWIVMGSCDIDTQKICRSRSRAQSKDCLFVSDFSHTLSSLDSSMKKFWEIENIYSPSLHLSKEDQRCEIYFKDNCFRTRDGRFVVPLPFIDSLNKPTFSDSRVIALRRFNSLERKLNAVPEMKLAYIKFMEDYEQCGHMELVEPSNVCQGQYYIPHHGILRPESSSTPLRVVFDASCKDSRGKSLNDTLLSGPKLQSNIYELLIRFRWHAVVFTADIKQMYRQILIDRQDADQYQRILWRSSPTEPLMEYRLLTVTYGVSSAPYLALRTISQLAEDSLEKYSVGSEVLKRDCYVDDVVSGADTVEEAVRVRSELAIMLISGGFHLRKWTSNCKEFLADLPQGDVYSEELFNFDDATDSSLKILGLLWRPHTDSFGFRVAQQENTRCTKRSILSCIARIYDPLGFLGPVTFLAKYIMQLLWTAGTSWDDDVPSNIASEWTCFESQLPSLTAISISRRLIKPYVVLQIHGFCDASERGYCAVIYFRVVGLDNIVSVEICCAKTKVAPLRKLSIPRLELQAAVLLSDLMQSALESLQHFHVASEIYCWSDSTVALAWIKSCPSRWKTFVANRVSHIQERISPECWRHVSSSSNPADCGSRGLMPNELVSGDLWWKGPSWLLEGEESWPHSSLSLSNSDQVLDEQRILSLVIGTETDIQSLLNKYSSLSKLKRIIAYCFRFIVHSRRSSKENRLVGSLETHESNHAFMFLIKYVQQQAFGDDIESLLKDKSNSVSRPLRKLSPFLDKEGVLRVGGRLMNAEVEFEVKHPILLPRSHRLTVLIIDEAHRKYMHPGAQTLQNLLAQSFWILSARRAIRGVVSRCVRCFRAHPRPSPAPLMGNLPSYRVVQVKPFSSVVIDFGGPFDISMGRGRGVKTFKAYICVFICTATKAIHIELASELSTEAFVAALKRFVARRGKCVHIVSDQGRNFVGASNHFGALMKQVTDAQEIKFSFSPPGSPHFNGLAEAGIKSVKTHISRVVGSQRLTFEEFYTLLSQIEMMLNSRPLTPLSSDANDLAVLTPGHFLTLEPLSMLPEESFEAQNISLLHRWKLIQKMHQDFWSRWHREYIHTLQQRCKWDTSTPEIQIGTLVLIVNEQLSPLRWSLGRITQLYPGTDGISRVATVKTASGVFKRPVVKLCPLPINA